LILITKHFLSFTSSRIRKLAFVVPLVVLIFVSETFPSIAQERLVAKVIRVSGLRGQIQNFSSAILSTIPADIFPDNRTRFDFTEKLKDEINPKALVEVAENSFEEQPDSEKLDQVVKFYESNTGRKVGKAQTEALSSHIIKAIREGGRTASSLDDERRQILERLISIQGVFENNILFRGLIIKSLDSANLYDPYGSSLENETKKKSFQPSRAKEADSLSQTALVCFAYTYRSLNSSDLDSFVKFEESQAGQWFNSKVSKVFQQFVVIAVGSLDKCMKNIRNNPRKE
jgi:hypothetical protein